MTYDAEKYNEILKLQELLEKENITHDFHLWFDGYRICYPCDGDKRVLSAIECFGSFGSREDKIEIMGLLSDEELKNDEVLGYLTAEEVLERIHKHMKGGNDV